ncbi:hypothetical protein BLNAU_24631 [Blattamonas nauphoetae]|uniref:Uncharacterized protein n=1 Tax=Blattamonas nauphoetae TaxID=2049346 RepID=A0ABQ9WLW4_9EUKA|nr:hypothetical protein BLNAU_24631 [Blattamonas nauphoetae]
MSTTNKEPDLLSSAARTDLSPSPLQLSMDVSPFLNWQYYRNQSIQEKSVIFQSLVATVKLQPTLDDSLETKAVRFLESLNPRKSKSAGAFLRSLGQTTDESLTVFIQSIVTLISSANQAITAAAMKMLNALITPHPKEVAQPLIKANLIPQLIITLNPQSLSFTEAVDIHINLMKIISNCVLLATLNGLARLCIKDGNEQQALHETMLKQVLIPSENYICHLCVNCFSIVGDAQMSCFLELLAELLRICPYFQPTMDFVLHMPVVLTIPSCLTFFEVDKSIWNFLIDMNNAQREWNTTQGEVRQMWKTVQRMLRMEGIEDVIEEKLRNNKSEYFGNFTVAFSIGWNNQQGMNLPQRE